MNKNFTNEYLKEILSSDKSISLKYSNKRNEAYFEPIWNDIDPPKTNLKLIAKLTGYTSKQHFINEEIAELKAIAKNSYSDFKSYQNEFIEVHKTYKKYFWKELVNIYKSILNREIFADEDLRELTQTLILTPLRFLIRVQTKQFYITQNGKKMEPIEKGGKIRFKDFNKDDDFEVKFKDEKDIEKISLLINKPMAYKALLDLASIRWDLAFTVNYFNFYTTSPLKDYFKSKEQKSSRESKRGRKKRIRENEQPKFRSIAESIVDNEQIGSQEDFYLVLAEKWSEEIREVEESTILI